MEYDESSDTMGQLRKTTRAPDPSCLQLSRQRRLACESTTAKAEPVSLETFPFFYGLLSRDCVGHSGPEEQLDDLLDDVLEDVLEFQRTSGETSPLEFTKPPAFLS